MVSSVRIVRAAGEAMRWFLLNRERIKRRFGPGFVAVRPGEVVAHSRDYMGLVSSLMERGVISGSVCICRV